MNNNPERTGVKQFLELTDSIPVIDVRTPSEYEKGHIPCALNIPLFTDKERAEVGTIYRQKSSISAIMKGLDIVGPKMSTLLKEGINKAGRKKRLMLYCWRGGSRSASMAWLFSNADIECILLEGGYKAYRKHILARLSEKRKIIILGGYTGSGKTAILNELSRMGEQVLDLEHLACHKGSAFGALGQKAQPGTEHFANLLHHAISDTDKSRRLFLEDESHNIGLVSIPHDFFGLMQEASVIALVPDIDTRLPRLVREYGIFSKDKLIDSVNKISKRLGSEKTALVIQAIENGNLEYAIRNVLAYYDKTYTYGLKQRPEDKVMYYKPAVDDTRANALEVKRLADKIL